MKAQHGDPPGILGLGVQVAALAWQFLALLAPTALMGATIPLGMNAIAKAHLPGERTSFSFLYLANVMGAALGTAS